MSITLAAMVSQLQASAPAVDGVPADYEQVVTDAVAQFSDDAPIRRRTTLSIVSGTATYTLPDDFLFLIGIEQTSVGDVLITDAGLVPFGGQGLALGDYHVEDGEITFIPDPGFTSTVNYRYAAAHELDESEIYQSLTVNGGRVALLYAQYLALSAQAEQAGGGWSYQIGDETVDKKNAGSELQNRAADALKRYQQALAGQKQVVGMRAKVTTGDMI